MEIDKIVRYVLDKQAKIITEAKEAWLKPINDEAMKKYLEYLKLEEKELKKEKSK